MKKNKFTIDRNIWLRGNPLNSVLLMDSDKELRCCVGIYCKILGIEDHLIRGIGFIELTPLCNKFPLPSDVLHELYRVNDCDKIDEITREKKIKNIFKTQGIKVNFIN